MKKYFTERVTGFHHYSGLGTDEKPDGPEGSTFHEMDTGRVYRYHEGVWYEDPGSLLAVFRALLSQLIHTPVFRAGISTGYGLLITPTGAISAAQSGTWNIGTLTTLSGITTFAYGQFEELKQRADMQYQLGQRNRFTF